MSEMIERVAKAIVKAYSGRDDANWNVFEAEARAAIKAMREPTEAMKEAWNRDFDGWLHERIEDEYHPYTVMIDEALK